jgi:hypothetical protein
MRAWEDNIKMYLTKIEREFYFPESEQETMVGSCEHGNKPLNSIKGESFLTS